MQSGIPQRDLDEHNTVSKKTLFAYTYIIQLISYMALEE